MSLSVEEICKYIESFAPVAWAEPWDQVGLQLGSLKTQIEHLGLALELTPEVVDWVFSEKIEGLLTHHPLFFRPLKGLREEDPWEQLIVRLVRGRRVVVSYHTNLDVAPGGVTEVLAEALGFKCERALKPISEDLPEIGLGRVGVTESPLSVSKIARRLAEIIRFPVFTVGPDREVKRIAICAGAGGDLIPQALQNGAEAYITGEVKHHAAREAEIAGLSLIVADHYAVEAYFLKHLKGRLSARFPGLKVSLFMGQSPFRLLTN